MIKKWTKNIKNKKFCSKIDSNEKKYKKRSKILCVFFCTEKYTILWSIFKTKISLSFWVERRKRGFGLKFKKKLVKKRGKKLLKRKREGEGESAKFAIGGFFCFAFGSNKSFNKMNFSAEKELFQINSPFSLSFSHFEHL